MTKYRAEPGEKISISCKTTGNSSIALLGVDQSVTLLETGNNIDKPRIAADMNGFNAWDNYPQLKVKGSEKNRYSEFGESNAFILTNAQDGKKTCEFIDRRAKSPEELARLVREDDDESDLYFDENVPLPKGEIDGIRRNFPETWMFKNFEADGNGKSKYTTNVPDTISSFIVTGFSLHPKKGLAIADQKKITVFKDFFLKIYLPYSVRLGEILKVDVSVFNYNPKKIRTISAKVEMFNNETEFEFIDPKKVGSECIKPGSRDNVRSKSISIRQGDEITSTFFYIKALITGQIKIKVKATSSGLKTDELERMMLVEHEGLTKSENVVRLLRPSEGFDSENFNLPIPEDQVLGNSIYIEASVAGDLIGPALSNIHNLM